MLFKLSNHRKFEYTPRIYDPKKEEQDEKMRPRIEFRSMRRNRKSRSFIWFLFLLLFVAYMIILLSKIAYNY
ncbi:MAG: hypothetical protein JXL67_13925 [Calditrichaeota bacterium]|nr:hypothetical protein [Calditrichota bacterium]